MNTRLHPLLVLALALAGPDALAQATSEGSVGSAAGTGGKTGGSATTGGIPPPVPSVQHPSATGTPNPQVDAAGQQPGFSAPRASESVVVPPFTPATPGVAPLDTPTNATVGASPSDSALRDSVVSAIGADPALKGARINVSVHDGVVNLSGTARDKAQADRARAVVERIAGSSKVNARIAASG